MNAAQIHYMTINLTTVTLHKLENYASAYLSVETLTAFYSRIFHAQKPKWLYCDKKFEMLFGCQVSTNFWPYI